MTIWEQYERKIGEHHSKSSGGVGQGSSNEDVRGGKGKIEKELCRKNNQVIFIGQPWKIREKEECKKIIMLSLLPSAHIISCFLLIMIFPKFS